MIHMFLNRRPLPWVALFILITALAATSVIAADDDTYVGDITAWRSEVEARLKADDGWLTIAGLFWLSEGEHTFGSHPDNDIVLPEGAPARVGAFKQADGKITVEVEPGVHVTMNGEAIQSAVLERGPRHTLSVGDLKLWVHGSGKRHAIRLRDPNSELRKEFTGLRWYPVNESFRVSARFVPYDEPKKVESVNIFGDAVTFTSPGELVFTIDGQEVTLQPSSTRNGGFHIIFRDQTSGKETYGAGRFLNAGAPVDGGVVLDFNRAYNPPCAYNPYTTCPMPPKQNHLPVAIEAGEKACKKTP
jgi:uncharacterized protein (DUF1684 family)